MEKAIRRMKRQLWPLHQEAKSSPKISDGQWKSQNSSRRHDGGSQAFIAVRYVIMVYGP